MCRQIGILGKKKIRLGETPRCIISTYYGRSRRQGDFWRRRRLIQSLVVRLKMCRQIGILGKKKIRLGETPRCIISTYYGRSRRQGDFWRRRRLIQSLVVRLKMCRQIGILGLKKLDCEKHPGALYQYTMAGGWA
jgi:hypothetical protein